MYSLQELNSVFEMPSMDDDVEEFSQHRMLQYATVFINVMLVRCLCRCQYELKGSLLTGRSELL